MPASFELENNDVGLIHISGKVSVAEVQRLQAECDRVIQKIGNIKLLAILDGFQGWQQEQGWEDSTFAERNDPFISKFAIVGEEKWRDLAYVFTLKGLRPVPIEYFDQGQIEEARAWLEL